MEIFLWFITGMWMIFIAFLFIPALLEDSPVERRSSKYLVRLFVFLVFAIIIIIILSRYEHDALILRVVPDTLWSGMTGVILTAIGLWFSIWARIHLGRFWSSMVMIKEGHQLVVTGPYRFVRNPMYTGILVASVGAAIAIGELLAFIAVGIGVIGVFMKIRAEEEILLEKFGEKYLQYRSKVKVIIPFIL